MCSWSHMYMLRWCMCVHVLTSFLIWICVPLISLAAANCKVMRSCQALIKKQHKVMEDKDESDKTHLLLAFVLLAWLARVLVKSTDNRVGWGGKRREQEKRVRKREVQNYRFSVLLLPFSIPPFSHTFPTTRCSSSVGILCYHICLCARLATRAAYTFSLLVLFPFSCM